MMELNRHVVFNFPSFVVMVFPFLLTDILFQFVFLGSLPVKNIFFPWFLISPFRLQFIDFSIGFQFVARMIH